MLNIQPIKLSDVEANPENYNSNNHWVNQLQPIDYLERSANGHTRHWINAFHQNYEIVEIYKPDLIWMLEAAQIGQQTGLFPKLFEEELNDLLDRYKYLDPIFKHNISYFVRTENVSLKYGQHGVGPYRNLKTVIESLVTSIPTHSPIKKSIDKIRLYFLPWVEINQDLEFRVFIHNNRITAISQQSCSIKNNFFDGLDQEIITLIINKIINYFNQVIQTKITHVQNFTIDLAIFNPLSEASVVYFIEINSFGREYSAGSSLFHWITDNHILYGTGSNIEFRYII